MSLILAAILAMQDSSEVERLAAELARARAENEQLRAKVAVLERSRVAKESRVAWASVTSVSDDGTVLGLSLGSRNDVSEGMFVALYRSGDPGSEPIGWGTVTRVGPDGSTARLIQTKEAPKVGDRVYLEKVEPLSPTPTIQGIESFPGTKAVQPFAPDELQQIRRELDELRRQVRELSDRRLPSYRSHGFAAEALPHELREHLGLKGGLLVRRVEPGSAAEKAGLRAWDVLPDLTEAGLIEALDQRRELKIVRRGK